MTEVVLNRALIDRRNFVFAGDFEVVGPQPWLGMEEAAALGCTMGLIHYHHRHEYGGTRSKGVWGAVRQQPGGQHSWEELDRTVEEAGRNFDLVGLYPIGWAHMVPQYLGKTVLDLPPESIAEWVAEVVGRYLGKVDVFPIFYEMNVFDLFHRATHRQSYGKAHRVHIVRALVASHDLVLRRFGPDAVSALTAGTFVELTRSGFYWMSEGMLLELPRGSALLEAPLSPPDLLATARELDAENGGSRHETAIRQLLHQLIVWNADDSGADNTIANDLVRIAMEGWFHDADANPQGFVHTMVAGWDPHPQNTYEYLMARMQPGTQVPTSAECLDRNYTEFQQFLTDPAVPFHVRRAVRGFILDDVFKCAKQSGITSALYPSEAEIDGVKVGRPPLHVSPLGESYAAITRRNDGRVDA